MDDRTFSAEELRTWASQCEDSAHDPRITGDERARLMKMKAALLDVARTADWLEGQPAALTVEFICENEADQ